MSSDAAAFRDAMRARNQWEPTFSPCALGDGIFHVAPCLGAAEMNNWPMGLRFWERIRGGGNYRLMYPDTEARLRRSIALCSLWCERKNAGEARARKIADSIAAELDAEKTS